MSFLYFSLSFKSKFYVVRKKKKLFKIHSRDTAFNRTLNFITSSLHIFFFKI